MTADFSRQQKNVHPSQTHENTGRTLNCAINLFDQQPPADTSWAIYISAFQTKINANTGKAEPSVSVFASLPVLVLRCEFSVSHLLRGAILNQKSADEVFMGEFWRHSFDFCQLKSFPELLIAFLDQFLLRPGLRRGAEGQKQWEESQGESVTTQWSRWCPLFNDHNQKSIWKVNNERERRRGGWGQERRRAEMECKDGHLVVATCSCITTLGHMTDLWAKSFVSRSTAH